MARRNLLLTLLLLGLACQSTAVAFAHHNEPWVQTVGEAELWSGPDAAAVSFGVVPEGTYLMVVDDTRPRIHVWNPLTDNYAFVDADRTVPSDDPPKEYLDPPPTVVQPEPSQTPEPVAAQPPAPPYEPWWVQTIQPTMLWSSSGSDAFVQGQITTWSYLKVSAAQSGSRLLVQDPLSGGFAYVDAASVGPAGDPSPGDLMPRTWRGYVGEEVANVRSAPDTAASIVGELHRGAPIAVDRWVEGEDVYPDQPGWAMLDEGAFVYGPLLRQAPLPAAPSLPQGGAPFDGRWIDVNLTLQAVTAYEGDRVVYMASTSSGRPGWETPPGVQYIQRRVEKETMDSSTLLGRDAERADYKVENVRWTQYITSGGVALHENYWRDPALFGIPSSHGCLGLKSADAEWLWNWANVGTPVVIHP